MHGFVHGFVAGVCRVRWFVVAALACWRGRVVLDCVVWCVLLGSLAATGPWCGVWLPVCPPGRLPGACWCGVGVLVGWWFENWIVDASIGPPVGVGLVFVL